MSEQAEKESDSKSTLHNKPFLWKYKLIPVFLLVIIICGYFYSVVIWKSKAQKASEKIIREIAAAQLNKDPKELADEDFAKITTFRVLKKDSPSWQQNKVEIYDIKFLKNFVNLEELDLSNVPLPEPDIPRWMIILAKLHIIDLYKNYYRSYTEKYFIDLNPLKQLSHLKIIRLNGTAIRDLKPLAEFNNLREIYRYNNQLTEHKILQGARISETVFINNKEYKLEEANWPRFIRNKYSIYIDPNEVSPLPKIKYSSSQLWLSSIKTTEMLIKHKAEDAIK